MSVRITKDRLPQVLASVKQLTKTEILVGIPEAMTNRSPEPGEKGPPPTNAELGYIHETGAPRANIPARPFLVPGIRDAMGHITRILRTCGEEALSGNPKQIQQGMMAAGQVAADSAKRKITDGPFTPLAPVTLAERQRRGRTGTKPMIDTGALRRAITYVLRSRKR